MQIKENELLAPYTTFKIGGPARFFCVVNDQFDALEAYKFAKEKGLKTFVMGGGSNVLVSDNGFDGLVIKVVNKGIEVLSENQASVLLKVASGETWDKVVSFAVNNGWWGIENLSHIPGLAGAIAVQNVGAYGQEAGNVIDSVTVFNIETHQILNIPAAECGFGYRKSLFNSDQKGKYIIFYVVLRLAKNGRPNLSYRDLKNKFADSVPTLQEIRSAIIGIRDKKYPFPTEAKNGNAGSFFKNVILDNETYTCVEEGIKKNFGNEALTKLQAKIFRENQNVKIPTAFLLDICGLKSIQVGGAMINKNQPLVIVNVSGQATSKDVLKLVGLVRKAVFEKIGLKLEHEPELIGFSTEEVREVES